MKLHMPNISLDPFFVNQNDVICEITIKLSIKYTCLAYMFSQCMSFDNTLENCFVQIVSYSCAYVRIIYEKTKGQIPPRPSLGNKTYKL